MPYFRWLLIDCMGLCSIFGKVYDLSGVRLGWWGMVFGSFDCDGFSNKRLASAQNLKQTTPLQISFVEQQIWTLSTLQRVM